MSEQKNSSMSVEKKVKLFASLCLISAIIVFCKGVIESTFGPGFLRFDPAKDALLKELLFFTNSLLDSLSNVLNGLPLYFALAGYYFYGAIGKERLAKFLIGLLIFIIALDVVLELIRVLFSALHIFNLVDFKMDSMASNFGKWFWGSLWFFHRLPTFVAIAFGVAALIEKKVSLSMRLVPVFAGILHLIVLYPAFRVNRVEIPDFWAILIYLGLIGLYLSGAIGENLWAKILFSAVLVLVALNIIFEISVVLINFLDIFGIASGVLSSAMSDWFLSFGKIKYVLLPIILITFAVTSVVIKGRNVVLQIIPLLAGGFYAIYYFLPNITYFVSASTINNLFEMIGFGGRKEIIWCLIGVAVLGASRLVSPFLISILALNFLHIFALLFLVKSGNYEVYGVMSYGFFISLIIHLIFTFYMWLAIDDRNTKVKPWLAVGLGLIPVFSFFGNLYLYSKYPTSFNEYIDRKSLETSYISSSPFIIYIALSVLITLGFYWIPFLLLAILSLGLFIVYVSLIIKTCSAIGRLDALDSAFPTFNKIVDSEPHSMNILNI